MKKTIATVPLYLSSKFKQHVNICNVSLVIKQIEEHDNSFNTLMRIAEYEFDSK
jgi:hypothetical protein